MANCNQVVNQILRQLTKLLRKRKDAVFFTARVARYCQAFARWRPGHHVTLLGATQGGR